MRTVLLPEKMMIKPGETRVDSVDYAIRDYLTLRWPALSDHTRLVYLRAATKILAIWPWVKISDFSPRFISSARGITLGIKSQMISLGGAAARLAFSEGYSPKVSRWKAETKIRTLGWAAWTREDLMKIAEAPPLQINRTMAGVVLFAAYTGMRRSDILKLSGENFCEISGKPHLTYKQKKTGALVVMPIPAALVDNVLVTRGMAGLRPVDNHMSESSFKHHYRLFLKTVGVDKPFHGLRKLCAVMMAEAGCSMPEIMSVTGHRSTATAAHYMRSANGRTLSTNAIERLDKHEVQDRLLKGQQQSVAMGDQSPEREGDGSRT